MVWVLDFLWRLSVGLFRLLDTSLIGLLIFVAYRIISIFWNSFDSLYQALALDLELGLLSKLTATLGSTVSGFFGGSTTTECLEDLGRIGARISNYKEAKILNLKNCKALLKELEEKNLECSKVLGPTVDDYWEARAGIKAEVIRRLE